MSFFQPANALSFFLYFQVVEVVQLVIMEFNVLMSVKRAVISLKLNLQSPVFESSEKA